MHVKMVALAESVERGRRGACGECIRVMAVGQSVSLLFLAANEAQ